MRNILVLALCLCLYAVTVQAQGGRSPVPRYQPSTPTVSPYLNMFRRDVGPLPNYYSLVRPQLNQIDINQRQRVINTQQQAQISDNRRSIVEVNESIAAPTGTGSVFRSYGHYYPGLSR